MATTTAAASAAASAAAPAPAAAPAADAAVQDAATQAIAKAPKVSVASRIGLSIPIREKCVKTFVANLAHLDAAGPKQIFKHAVIAVSAIQETMLHTIVEAAIAGAPGTGFTVDDVTRAVRENPELRTFRMTLAGALDRLEAGRAARRARLSGAAADDTAAAGGDEEDAPDKSSYSFSYAKLIARVVKETRETPRVSSEAVELVQSLLDDLWQSVVTGAFWVAHSAVRKTISKADALVVCRILLPASQYEAVEARVEAAVARLRELDDARAKGDKSAGPDSSGAESELDEPATPVAAPKKAPAPKKAAPKKAAAAPKPAAAKE